MRMRKCLDCARETVVLVWGSRSRSPARGVWRSSLRMLLELANDAPSSACSLRCDPEKIPAFQSHACFLTRQHFMLRYYITHAGEHLLESLHIAISPTFRCC